MGSDSNILIFPARYPQSRDSSARYPQPAADLAPELSTREPSPTPDLSTREVVREDRPVYNPVDKSLSINMNERTIERPATGVGEWLREWLGLWGDRPDRMPEDPREFRIYQEHRDSISADLEGFGIIERAELFERFDLVALAEAVAYVHEAVRLKRRVYNPAGLFVWRLQTKTGRRAFA